LYAYHNCARVTLTLAGKSDITLVLQSVLVTTRGNFHAYELITFPKLYPELKAFP